MQKLGSMKEHSAFQKSSLFCKVSVLTGPDQAVLGHEARKKYGPGKLL